MGYIAEQYSVMAAVPYGDLAVAPTPFSFALSGRTWKPYEFVTDCGAAKEGLAAVISKSGFLEELADAVAGFDLQDVLGFHILHRDFLGSEARGTIETPGYSEDELLLRPYTEELFNELVGSGGHQVMWSWCNKKAPIGHLCV